MSLGQSFHLDGIKKIIAVSSGKGGVGKSTTTVNLALAIAKTGARVGVLDADIYGPNQPHMLGVSEKPTLNQAEKILPVMRYDLQTMSMGYLVDDSEPMVWRGPMVVKAFQQLLHHTAWDNLDYLLIDLPPGTGDIQLTLSQKVPVNGAVLVTTPQDVALIDVRKGFEMFQKVNVPVLGVIENMSTYHCPSCGHEAKIFGDRGGERMAKDCGLDLLGQIPLSLSVREQSDRGEPLVIAEPEGEIAKMYGDIAGKVINKL